MCARVPQLSGQLQLCVYAGLEFGLLSIYRLTIREVNNLPMRNRLKTPKRSCELVNLRKSQV